MSPEKSKSRKIKESARRLRPIAYMRIACLLTAVAITLPAYAAIPPDVEIQDDLDRVFSEELSVKGYPYQELMQDAAERYDLPLAYVLAVARGESFFNPNAESVKGAIGIMQVMPSTAKNDFGVSKQDLYDPATNIDVGVHYLAKLYERFEDPYLALAAYYCGPGGINAEDRTVRKDCNEYVRYIHTHLTNILARAEGKTPTPRGRLQKLVITRFDNYLDARDFLKFINPQLKNLQLDLFRIEVQMADHLRFQYQIIAAHGEETGKEQICRQIEEVTGFSLCEDPI